MQVLDRLPLGLERDAVRVQLRGNPVVSGPGAIRFYAAHPLESIDGYRIGVLCVWDDVPHDVGAFDVSALRDLALLAEAEIIGDVPR